MFIAIAIASIFGITALVWFLNKFLPRPLCPICIGVSGTWVWMLGALVLGYEVELIFPALLMGGSVVGVAYQLEKRLPENASPLLWKALFIPSGFAAFYSVLVKRWGVLAALSVIVFSIAIVFFRKSPNKGVADSRGVEELEEKMKNCC